MGHEQLVLTANRDDEWEDYTVFPIKNLYRLPMVHRHGSKERGWVMVTRVPEYFTELVKKGTKNESH